MKSQIKKVFKQPLKLLRKILNRNNKQRKYETYQDALANCHNHNYESVDLVKVVVEKTVLFSEAINQDPTLDIGALRTLIAIGFTRKSDLLLRVLDFGGRPEKGHEVVFEFVSGADLTPFVQPDPSGRV